LPLYFDTLAQTATKRDDISDDLVFSRMWEHGVAIVEVSADEVLVNFHNINSKLQNAGVVERNYYNNPEDFLAMVHKHTFRVAEGRLEEL